MMEKLIYLHLGVIIYLKEVWLIITWTWVYLREIGCPENLPIKGKSSWQSGYLIPLEKFYFKYSRATMSE